MHRLYPLSVGAQILQRSADELAKGTQAFLVTDGGVTLQVGEQAFLRLVELLTRRHGDGATATTTSNEVDEAIRARGYRSTLGHVLGVDELAIARLRTEARTTKQALRIGGEYENVLEHGFRVTSAAVNLQLADRFHDVLFEVGVEK